MKNVFETAIAKSLGIRAVELNVQSSNPVDVIRLTRPTRIAVSPRFPGRHWFQIGLGGEGKNADEEALATLLVTGIHSRLSYEERMHSVMQLRELLLNGELTNAVMNQLFPRPATHLARGTYFLTEESVYSMTIEIVGKMASDANGPAVTAYSRMLARMLRALGFLSAGSPEMFAEEDITFALSIHDLHKAYLIEKLKPALSGTLMTQRLKDVDLGKKNATAVLAQRVADVFQLMASALLQVAGADREFATAIALTHQFVSDVTMLPNSMQQAAELAALADLANVTATLLDPDFLSDGISLDPFEYSAAVKSVYGAIWSVQSISIITLEQYREHFLVAPAVSAKGLVLGGVVAMPLSQKSELRVVTASKLSADSTHIEVLPPSLVATPALSNMLNATVNSTDNFRGLVHLAADDLAKRASNAEGGPQLLLVGINDSTLLHLAFARSSELSLGTIDGMRQIIFGVNRASALGVEPRSAVGTLLFFTTPADAVGFSLHTDEETFKPMPQRPQSLPSSFRAGRIYGSIDGLVSDSIQRPFESKISMQTGDDVLPISLSVKLARRMADLETTRSRMAVIIEPGVALDACRQFALYNYLVGSMDITIRHRAIGWIANLFRVAMRDAQIGALAEQTLLAAVQETGIDARALAPYTQRVLFFAYVMSIVGALARLDVLHGDIATEVLQQLNLDDISLALGADMPAVPLHVTASLTRKQ